MEKTYEINTIQDIIDCTNKSNLDNFLKDFRAMLEIAHSLQELANAVVEAENIPKEMGKMKNNGFTWTDDGEHNISIEIGTTQTIV